MKITQVTGKLAKISDLTDGHGFLYDDGLYIITRPERYIIRLEDGVRIPLRADIYVKPVKILNIDYTPVIHETGDSNE